MILNRFEETGGGIKTFVGSGLSKAHQQPLLNKYYVNRKLLNSGVLDIRYLKNGHKTHIGSKSLLSDNAKKIFNNMFDGKEIDTNDFIKLNNFEKDLVRQCNNHYLGGKYKLNDDDDDLFHKNFKILLGEWNAGNNNIIIKKQLETYLDHAVDLGKLSHHEKRRIERSLFKY